MIKERYILTLIAVSAEPARVADAVVVSSADAVSASLSAQAALHQRYLAPDLTVIAAEAGRTAALVHTSTSTSIQTSYATFRCNKHDIH